jgi:hypothetical protein
MSTHVIVTWASPQVPAVLIVAGVLTFVGIPLTMATRYPLAAYTGAAMAFAGWVLGFGWSLTGNALGFTVFAAAVALFWGLRMWSLVPTVQKKPVRESA